jgi:sigma-B regulation protein RsbU (phosphoserine phosphatase)
MLGDVAGKGPPAALIGSFILGAFESNAGPHATPATTLATVNKGMMSHHLESRFATLFYALLTDTGMLTYCNGAHNPPVILHAKGIDRLEEGGVVLGLFGEAPYVDTTVPLAAGDLVVVFSDGVTEAQSDTFDEFGFDRLLQVVKERKTESTSQIADGIVSAVAQFSAGSAMSDDVSLMVLRYQP